MRRRRVAVVAVLCGTAALAVCGAAGLASFTSLGFENTSRPLVEDRRAISVRAEPMALSQATAMREDGVSVGDPNRTEPAVVLAALPVARVAIETALPDASAMLPPKAPPLQMAMAIWDHHRDARSIWIASLLRADMIFGKDRAWPKPRRDADAAGRDSKADLGTGGVGLDPRATELKTDLFRLRVYHPSKATTG